MEHRETTLRTRGWLAAGGALGAALWAVQQPLDKRLLRSGYDDVELLGRAFTQDRWRALGWALHVANGAAFGAVYSELARRTPRFDPMASAVGMALAEHAALFPLGAIVDRVHPAREALAPIFGRRQFAQATWRHLVLGVVLGAVARRAFRR